ncbi:Auxin efflux carrier [Penicillium atrosanguineum]|uniref:Auxin efflux carrier n=1 Tax=Penicillium atrosanguineum TaxID=1132637 RepID=A0A9W9U777_9EURO|nr:Auxin efflux carrier [Penicillium atrosanguineum]
MQGCLSRSLVLFKHAIARGLRLIHDATINDFSGLGVKLLLPALIVVNLGQQDHLSTALNYFLSLVSDKFEDINLGILVMFPCAFSLTHIQPTSMDSPSMRTQQHSISLLAALTVFDSVGPLRLILRGREETPTPIERAQRYSFVCAVVSKAIDYVVGPKMRQDGPGSDLDHEKPRITPSTNDDELLTETTPLLPQRAQNARRALGSCIRSCNLLVCSFFPDSFEQHLLSPVGDIFADVVIGCTLLAALIGLVPALHRAFFARDDNRGSLPCMADDQFRFELTVADGDSKRILIWAMATLFVVRLVIWPALKDDPKLWFSMMLMPTGPLALVIFGLAELAHASKTEKMAIAKTSIG